MVDLDLRIVMFEGLGLARAGWRDEELVGKTIADALPAARAEEITALRE